MQWTSALAIYLLFWVMSAFLVMPFGIRTHQEAGLEQVKGQAESAPVNFSARRIVLRTTIVSLALFALYYVNYVNGWVTTDDINIFGTPPNYDGSARNAG